jgi:hypothetical protein
MCTVLLGLMGCKESDPLSSEKEITGFIIERREAGELLKGDIKPTREIVVSIPVTTNLDTKWLIPTIEVSPNAKVSPASGAAQDFSKSVVYTVTAEDGTTQEYLVLTSISGRSSTKQITAFAIPGQVGTSVLNETNKTIEVSMPVGTDLSALIPVITLTGSGTPTVSPASLVAQDFSKGPVVYTVTAQDGSTQDYTVVVKEAPRAIGNELTALTINGQVASTDGTPNPVVSGTTSTVTVPVGTDVRALIPSFTIPDTATVSPASGAAQDFTNPVVYTVTAENGLKQDYTVVVKEATRAPDKTFTALAINGQVPTSTTVPNPVLTGTTLLTVTMPVGTDLRALIPSFIIPNTATVSPVLGAAQDFTNPVVYTVTAEDSSTQDYTVVVKEAARATEKTIDAFSINGVDGSIDSGNRTITFNTGTGAGFLAVGIDVNSLIPAITLTPSGTGATAAVTSTVSPASLKARNFTNPVVYTVTAQDGSKQDYTVVIKKQDAKDLSGVTINAKSAEAGNGPTFVVILPPGTDRALLTPTFTLSTGATAYPASGTPQDFTGPKTYTVTAENGSTKEFVIAVVVQDPKTTVSIDLAGKDKGIEIYSTPAFNSIADRNIRLSLNGGGGTYAGSNPSATSKEAVVSIQVKNPIGTWSVTNWKVDGRAYATTTDELYGTTSNIITLKASNYFIGRHSVTFTVEVNGKPYSEQFYFTVDK